LAAEPLLLFMLAVYDFEKNELHSDITDDKQFNQSKLYDKLFEKFTTRQIEKEPTYDGMDISEIERLKKYFRLRLVQFLF